MVFGWGKKKEEKITENTPALKEIQLTEVEEITRNLIKLRTSQTLSEIKSLRNQIEPLIKELASIARSLEKDDLKVDEIDKHLRIIVVRGKKQVLDIIKKETNDLPQISSFEDALDVSNMLNQKLKKIGDVLGRQTRVIHIFAKKYAEKLKEILAQMNSDYGEIQSLIKNLQDTNSKGDEISQILQEIKNSQSDSAKKNQRILELQNSFNSYNKKISDIENSIETIKSGDHFKEFLKLKEMLSSFNNKKLQIKNEIDTQFTKISRPLGRYEYVSSLDREQKLLLSQIINDPLNALIFENKDAIVIILENVRKGIVSGSISVKDVDKSLSYLTETEELLENFICKIHDFNEKKKEMEKKLSEFNNDELSYLEKDLEKTLEQKKDTESKISSFKKDVQENRENIPKRISKIENMLKRFSNTSYTIMNPSES